MTDNFLKDIEDVEYIESPENAFKATEGLTGVTPSPEPERASDEGSGTSLTAFSTQDGRILLLNQEIVDDIADTMNKLIHLRLSAMLISHLQAEGIEDPEDGNMPERYSKLVLEYFDNYHDELKEWFDISSMCNKLEVGNPFQGFNSIVEHSENS